MSTITRRIGYAAAAAATSVGVAVAAAPGASAEPVWTLNYKATVSTYVAKPGKTVTFTGTQVSQVDLGKQSNNLTSDLQLGTSTMKVDLPIIPGKLSIPSIATATLKIEPVGKTTGTFNGGNIDAVQTFNIHITRLQPALLGFINLVPSTCITETPVKAHLTGKVTGFWDPFTLKTNYTIPKFKGCGLLNGVINNLTSDSGNTLTATFDAA